MSGFDFPIRRIGEGQKSGLKRRRQADLAVRPKEMEKEIKMADSLTEKKEKWLRTGKWIYWSVTLLFVSTMMVADVMYLAGGLL